MPNPRAPMILDSTGQAMVTKLEAIKTAIENGGGGGGGTTVIANPSGAATADLEKLQVGSTIYGIPEGTEVEANPSGSGSTDLLKLKVGSDIYNIPSGGGGGGVVGLGDCYSTTERQIGCWIDSKPLYEKTFVRNSTDARGTYVSFDVSDLDIDTCVSVNGICDRIVPNIGVLTYDMNSHESSMYHTYLCYSDFDSVIQYAITFNFNSGEATSYQKITIQYTKAADVPGTGSSGQLISLGECYSPEERQVGSWVDGKPLYQRSYAFSESIPSGQTVVIGTLSGYDNIVSAKGWLNESGSYYFINDMSARIKINSNGQLQLYVTSSWNGSGYVTIQYTKTADTPGSGIWSQSGVPSVHHSTTEQVIGTWTDGKPLYRKTVVFNTGEVASNIDFNISSYMPANCVVHDASFTIDFTYGGNTHHGVNWGGSYIEIDGVHYLSFTIGAASYDKHIELTIEYTKTTD